MFNQYQNIELKDGKLNISGSSFNVGGNYSKDTNVERKIIFENTKTFERFEFDLGYIDDGEYPITLVVPDNLDKTREIAPLVVPEKAIVVDTTSLSVAEVVDTLYKLVHKN